jgi:hypothetical protein
LELDDSSLSVVKEPVSGIQLLKQNALESLCQQDVENLLNTYANSHKARATSTKTQLAFLPSFHQACWHYAKEEYMHKQSGQPPTIKGAISTSGRTWMYWYHDIGASKLKIQRVVLLDQGEHQRNEEELYLLFRQALKCAADWNIKKVIAWRPCDDVRRAALKVESAINAVTVRFEERENSSIPSLRMVESRGGESIEWDANEYYAWC